MSSPYIGEIRMFGGSFAPAGWAFCSGQLLPISENDTLFNLIGTTYGGDGQETFALPDLQGRVPLHAGQGPGISQNYQLGEKAGVETVTLSTAQLPSHTHSMLASTDNGTTPNPKDNILATTQTTTPYIALPATTPLTSQSILPIGGSQPHENMQPYLVVSFIISLFGIFPSQS